MKLKLLLLSLICLIQIDIHCAAAAVDTEAYPDSEHYDQIVLGMMAQIDESMEKKGLFESKKNEVIDKEKAELKKENAELKSLLNDARYVASRGAELSNAQISELQRQNAALQADLKQAKDLAATLQAGYLQAQNNVAIATNTGLAWQRHAADLQRQLDAINNFYANQQMRNTVAVTTFPLMVANN